MATLLKITAEQATNLSANVDLNVPLAAIYNAILEQAKCGHKYLHCAVVKGLVAPYSEKVRNAVAKELKKNGYKLIGIFGDSGNIAWD